MAGGAKPPQDSKEASLGRPAEKILWKKKDEFSLVALSVSLDYADAFIDALRPFSVYSVFSPAINPAHQQAMSAYLKHPSAVMSTTHNTHYKPRKHPRISFITRTSIAPVNFPVNVFCWLG